MCLLCLGRYDFNEYLSGKLQMNLAPEAGVSQVMGDIDVKARASTPSFHAWSQWTTAEALWLHPW